MSWPSSIRGPVLVALVAALACASCSSDETSPVDPGGEDACVAGFARDERGICAPLVPSGDCAAGSFARLGQQACEPVGWRECGVGFEVDATGWGCREILPAEACPAGTMRVLGETACAPVGWTSCPQGFEPDASGWGCRDVQPAAPCTGATRAALGETSCVPVGDCAAAFPPADATLFVDAAFLPEQLDASHFATISDAVAAATLGDVIAVESGTYLGNIAPAASITVAGRCAAEVIIDGGGGASNGVRAVNGMELTVRGLTLHDHNFGVGAIDSSQVTLEDVVISDARTMGVYAVDDGSTVHLSRSVVRASVSVPSDPDSGFGALAEDGGRIDIDDSEIADNTSLAVFTLGDGSEIHLTGSLVQRTKSTLGGSFGHGLHAQGGSITATRSAVVGNRTLGGYATDDGALIRLEDSLVRDTQPTFGDFGIGLQADTGGRVEVERGGVVDNHFIGVFLFDDSTASLVDAVVRGTTPLPGAKEGGRGLQSQEGPAVTILRSAIVDNQEYGLVSGASGSSIDVTDSIVAGTRRPAGGRHGWGLNVADGGVATVHGSAIEDNRELGIGVGPGSRVDLVGSIVAGTERTEGVTLDDEDYGIQAIAAQEGAAVTLDGCAILSNRQVGLYASGADADTGAQSRIDAVRTVVRGGLAEAAEGEGNGAGAFAGFGGAITLASSLVAENVGTGLLVDGAGSTMDAKDVVVRGNLVNNDGILGRGASVQLGGRLILDHAALVENHEITLFVADGGSSVVAESTLIAATLPDTGTHTGRGVAVQYQASLEMRHSAVTRSRDIGVHVVGGGAQALLEDTLVGPTLARDVDLAFGHGFFVDLDARLTLTRSRVFDSQGIGIAFSRSGGTVAETLVDRNKVGIHAQEGSILQETASLPAEQTPGTIYVLQDTQFVDNTARVGSGNVAIPEAVGQVSQ